MDDLAELERELDVARAHDDNAARVRLITRSLELPGARPHLPQYLDELAYAYEELGRFEEAIDAMRRAVAAGWDGELDDHPSAQALIADLLLRAGRTQEADEAWLEAERHDPNDPNLFAAAGRAYASAGLHDEALRWQSKGLELALEAGETHGELIWLLSDERAETLRVLGRPPDDLQHRAKDPADRQERRDREQLAALRRDLYPAPVAPQRASVGVAWFPADQFERALELWPSFAADYEHGPYAAYCGRLEALLRDLRARGAARLALAPIAIDDYLSWCAGNDRDPEQPDSRADFATELVQHGIVQPWPPRRNERCWCGSGVKYKKCCQRAG